MKNNNNLTRKRFTLKECCLRAGVVSMLLSQAALSAAANPLPDLPQMDEISSSSVLGVPGLSLHEVVRQPDRSVFLIKAAGSGDGKDSSDPGINLNMFLLCAPAKVASLHGYMRFSYALTVRDSNGAFILAPDNKRQGQQPLFESVTWFGDARPDQTGAAWSPPGALIEVAAALTACKAIAQREAPVQGNVERAPADALANQNCNGRGPMLVPASPQEAGASVIAPTLTAEVRAAIAQEEQRINGELDPEYRNNPRLIVHPDTAPDGSTVMVAVPFGMPVAIGQHVTYQSRYADPTRACHYLPSILIMKPTPSTSGLLP